jgi:acyl carrier protein
MEAILAMAFERYVDTSGLFGTPESCLELLDRVKAQDVDEVACLIDFGVSTDVVLANLPHLNALRALSTPGQPPAPQPARQHASLPALIRRHHVTHVQCTPSLARMLLMDPDARAALATLKHLLIGGEALPDTLAAQLTALVPGEVLNMYGPTETTIWSSTSTLEGLEHGVSIGRPIANTQFYVVDEALQPVPVGVAGELLIGGAGVARGYLHRPDLTAERFIRDPFRPQAEARLYRTGDRVRYRPDGHVAFLGRLDHQVKLRGHRIELPEIEAQLNQHRGVRESVVLAREDVPGDTRLVAYVTMRGDWRPQGGELRAYLQERLPDVMVPATVVVLEAFPLTPNQKIDRQMLPPPEPDAHALDGGFEAPSTAVEEQLAQIWAELLGVEHVGRQDHFFDLGGHSLLAVSLVNRVERVFGTRLPLTTLRALTLAQMAAVLPEGVRAAAVAPKSEDHWVEGELL